MSDTNVTPADDEEILLEVVCLAAGLGIKAALSMQVDGDEWLLPRRGWAPPPATGAPEVEYAFALAVQALVYGFDLDPTQVETIADGLLKRAGL